MPQHDEPAHTGDTHTEAAAANLLAWRLALDAQDVTPATAALIKARQAAGPLDPQRNADIFVELAIAEQLAAINTSLAYIARRLV